MVTQTCPDCQGNRLRPESASVTIGGLSIIDLSQMPLAELLTWIERLPEFRPSHPERRREG